MDQLIKDTTRRNTDEGEVAEGVAAEEASITTVTHITITKDTARDGTEAL